MSQGVCRPRRLQVFLFPCEQYRRSMVIGPCTFLQSVLGGVTWPWVWNNLFTGFSSLLHSLVDRPQETWWPQTSTVTFGFTSLSGWKPGVGSGVSLGVRWAGSQRYLGGSPVYALCCQRIMGAISRNVSALTPHLLPDPPPLPDSSSSP